MQPAVFLFDMWFYSVTIACSRGTAQIQGTNTCYLDSGSKFGEWVLEIIHSSNLLVRSTINLPPEKITRRLNTVAIEFSTKLPQQVDFLVGHHPMSD
jgi:hypothetical protein